MEQLNALAEDFKGQTSYRFFSASALIMYDGSARSGEETRVAVRLIDFAHAFPIASHREGEQGVDNNTLAGLTGLIAACEQSIEISEEGAAI